MTSEEMLLDLGVTLHSGHDLQRQTLMAVLAGRLGYSSIVLPAGAARESEDAIREAVGDLAIVRVDDESDPTVVRTAEPSAVRQARESLDAQGDPRPVEVAVSLSIGRTFQEAEARASRDPRFNGDAHPSNAGIYGTFEQAQERVMELARAGAGALRITPADDPDVADLLAQVRALVVGPTVVIARGGLS